jgi:hypothetical protein
MVNSTVITGGNNTEEINSCLQGLNKVPKEKNILQEQLDNAALRLVTLQSCSVFLTSNS